MPELPKATPEQSRLIDDVSEGKADEMLETLLLVAQQQENMNVGGAVMAQIIARTATHASSTVAATIAGTADLSRDAADWDEHRENMVSFCSFIMLTVLIQSAQRWDKEGAQSADEILALTKLEWAKVRADIVAQGERSNG